MQTTLITISIVLTIIAMVPYILEVLRGTTKPRIVSWFTWGLLTGIACAASFSEGHVPTALLTLAATIESMTVVALGFKHGDRKFERLDIGCLFAVAAGLGLWALLKSPTAAVAVVIAVDFAGGIPTLKHSWQKPHEETWVTFALSGIASIFTLLASESLAFTAVAYPLYFVIINSVFTFFLLASPHRHAKGEPEELREL